MCILLGTTAHPRYSLILISNRDEFYERETHPTCVHSDDFIVSPFDMSITTKGRNFGTWCGVNKDGKVAVILNLRIASSVNPKNVECPQSRGIVPMKFLAEKDVNFNDWDSYEKFLHHYPGIEKTGNFNLFYGDCSKGEYKLISSLSETTDGFQNDDGYMVVSNDLISSKKKWGKISLAKNLLQNLVESSVDDTKDSILDKCFELASHSTCSEKIVVKRESVTNETIYVPPLLVENGQDLDASMPCGKYYGTRSQIVILVSKDQKKMTFVERVLYTCDEDVLKYGPKNPKEQIEFEFDI